jgi:hypothetical protein
VWGREDGVIPPFCKGFLKKKGLREVNFLGHLSSRKAGFLKKLFEFFW